MSVFGAILAAAIITPGASGQAPPVSISGGFNAVGQWAPDDSVRSEVVASLDLFGEADFGPVRLVAYLEANTTPFTDGVFRLLGEANTDAGTALNRRGGGRVQLSELRLVLPLGASDVHVGMLDATGFIDVSRIANDENLFFLGVPFVNNPTIDFPDYAVGAAAEGRLGTSDAFRYGLVATSSHGLADNPRVSYPQLLHLDDEGKGVFLGGTVKWEGSSHRLSLGSWVDTGHHPYLSGAPGGEGNRGVFGVAEVHGAHHSVSGRVGWANDEVSSARGFLGLTYLGTIGPNGLGLALGRSVPSTSDPELKPVTHGEAFLRRHVWHQFFATLSAQRIVNSGFGAGVGRAGDGLWVFGVRMSAQF